MPEYIGPDRQLTQPKPAKQITPPKEPLPPEEVLRRRAEEADIHTFFRGEDVQNRDVTADEADALANVVRSRVATGRVKVVPFSFDQQDNDEQ